MSDLYAKLFLDTQLEHKALLRRIAKHAVGEEVGWTVLSSVVEIDVFPNSDHSLPEQELSSEDFIYYPFVLDVEPVPGKADIHSFLAALSNLMHKLKSDGMCMVVACDWEERLPGGGRLGFSPSGPSDYETQAPFSFVKCMQLQLGRYTGVNYWLRSTLAKYDAFTWNRNNAYSAMGELKAIMLVLQTPCQHPVMELMLSPKLQCLGITKYMWEGDEMRLEFEYSKNGVPIAVTDLANEDRIPIDMLGLSLDNPDFFATGFALPRQLRGCKIPLLQGQ